VAGIHCPECHQGYINSLLLFHAASAAVAGRRRAGAQELPVAGKLHDFPVRLRHVGRYRIPVNVHGGADCSTSHQFLLNADWGSDRIQPRSLRSGGDCFFEPDSSCTPAADHMFGKN